MSLVSRFAWGGKLLVQSKLLGLVLGRRRTASHTTDADLPAPTVNTLPKVLHPAAQAMKVTAVKDETKDMRTIRLEAADGHELAYFYPGQYIPVYVEIDGNQVVRPYALSSSPEEALAGYYEISVKRSEGGFVSSYIHDHVNVGDSITVGGPDGLDYYMPLRDAKQIVGIAGGTGVTAFRSMAKAIVDGTLDCSLMLIYGCNTPEEIAFADEWETYKQASNGKFDYVFVVAEGDVPGAEQGFITAEILQKYCDPTQASLFINGPKGLVDFMHEQLAPFHLERRYVRYGIQGDASQPGAEEKTAETYTIKVHQAGEEKEIPARADETILKALERAGVQAPASCRSGICGFCRAALISGTIRLSEGENGVRARDQELGFIHPCCSFPTSDLEIVVQRNRK